jgi:hypothetical protein
MLASELLARLVFVVLGCAPKMFNTKASSRKSLSEALLLSQTQSLPVVLLEMKCSRRLEIVSARAFCQLPIKRRSITRLHSVLTDSSFG